MPKHPNLTETVDFEELGSKLDLLIKLPLSKLLGLAAKERHQHVTSAVFYAGLSNASTFNQTLVQKLVRNKDKLSPNSLFNTALWIPDWDQSIEIDQITETIAAQKELLEKFELPFFLLLPDPMACLEKSRNASLSLEDFYSKFTALGECQTQAVTNDTPLFNLFRRTMSAGIKVRIALDVFLLEDPLHVLKGPEINNEDNLGLLRLCNEAYEICEELKEFSNLYSIYITSSFDDSKQTLSSPFAVPLLRLICLLRHIFPPGLHLSTSPSLVGKSLYLLLDELGVNSYCEGALDLTSAEKLHIPLLSEIGELKYDQLGYAS